MDIYKDRKLTIMITLVGVLTFSIALTFLSTIVSHYNYPGAFAMEELHSYIKNNDTNNNKRLNIYLDGCTAMTGASRFLQIEEYNYFKDENLKDYNKFHYILLYKNSKIKLQEFKLIKNVKGYNGITSDFIPFYKCVIKNYKNPLICSSIISVKEFRALRIKLQTLIKIYKKI